MPEFKTYVDIILYTHKMLREATPEQLEAYLMKTLAPGYFLKGSDVMLTQRGADLINATVRIAHKLEITYKEAYCPDPKVAHHQKGMIEFYSKVGRGKTRIAAGQYGGAFKEGVKVGQKWKISDLSVHVPNKKEQIEYLRSFADPNELCKPKKK